MTPDAPDGVIVRLAARGDGVTGSGRMVPLAAPGDAVTADGRVLPGPHRAAPPCRHFPQCGGCQLQHVDDDAYAEFVRDRVVGPLRAAVTERTVVAPTLLSPPRSRRRATLGARWEGGRLALGFRAQGTHRIIDMRECWLLTGQLFAAVSPIRRWLTEELPRSASAGVHLQACDQGLDVILTAPAMDAFERAPALQMLAQILPAARLSVDAGSGPMTVWEPEPVTVSLTAGDRGAVAVPLPPGAFLQPSAEGERALQAEVTGQLGSAASVADLFAGLGTFALAAAAGGRRVRAVEGGRDAIAALDHAARIHGLPIGTEHRDLFRRPLSATELAPYDCVIIDPPRAGAADQCAALAASKVARIVAVSCNPATLGRDVATLVAGGYRLDRVRPIGQFRWSTHVEAVAVLTR